MSLVWRSLPASASTRGCLAVIGGTTWSLSKGMWARRAMSARTCGLAITLPSSSARLVSASRPVGVLAGVDQRRQRGVDDDLGRRGRHLQRARRQAGRGQADVLDAPDRGEQGEAHAQRDPAADVPKSSEADAEAHLVTPRARRPELDRLLDRLRPLLGLQIVVVALDAGSSRGPSQPRSPRASGCSAPRAMRIVAQPPRKTKKTTTSAIMLAGPRSDTMPCAVPSGRTCSRRAASTESSVAFVLR